MDITVHGVKKITAMRKVIHPDKDDGFVRTVYRYLKIDSRDGIVRVCLFADEGKTETLAVHTDEENER